MCPGKAASVPNPARYFGFPSCVSITLALSRRSKARVGEFVQVRAGTTAIDVAGTRRAQFGRVLAAGNATLAGGFDADAIDGFTPDDGQRFTFLVSDGRSGTFPRRDFSGLPSGTDASVVYGNQTATLRIT